MHTLPSKMSCALTAETLQPRAVAAWMHRLLFCRASLLGSSPLPPWGKLSALSSMVSGTQEFSSLLHSRSEVPWSNRLYHLVSSSSLTIQMHLVKQEGPWCT